MRIGLTIMEEKVYFDFLQVAVGNRKSLSGGISDADWLRLFELCKRQALIGVGFTAVEKLHAMGVVCPAGLRMQWLALTLQIEKRNILLNQQCSQLARKYEHDGLSTCILKGQGNCLNYPEGLRNRRQCGDIDLWATPISDEECILNEECRMNNEEWVEADGGIAIAVQTGKDDVEYVVYHGRKAVMEYVRMLHRLEGNNEKPIVRYHHIEAPKMDGTEVEVHFRPCYAHSPLRNWRMQRWFEEHADVCMKNKTHMGFAVPTASVNVVYQMCHLFSHYFDEGLGLRQLMDYYFALRVWHNDVMECKDLQTQGMWSEGLGTPVMSKEEVMSVMRSFGMARFATAVMYVLQEVFFKNEECRMKNEEWPAELEPWMICEPNEREGRKLLEEIMKGGNFGQYDERGKEFKNGGMIKHGLWKLKRVMRLVRSYPEEALWEPVFRVWHLGWRMIHG